MLLLAFSSNVTPRIFFVTAHPPPRVFAVNSTIGSAFVSNIDYGVQRHAGPGPHVASLPRGAGPRATQAGVEGPHGEEDRSGRALLVPRLRGLLENNRRGRRSGHLSAGGRTACGLRQSAARRHGRRRHRAERALALRAWRADRAR